MSTHACHLPQHNYQYLVFLRWVIPVVLSKYEYVRNNMIYSCTVTKHIVVFCDYTTILYHIIPHILVLSVLLQ